MKKEWMILGGVTCVASLIIAAPLLPNQEQGSAAPTKTASHPRSVTMLLVGDIMLDRGVALHAQDVGDGVLFKGVEKLFAEHDAVIGNLEGAMTEQPSIAQRDHSVLRFTFDPRFAGVLAQLGFSALSLANNHTLDFGEQGYHGTVEHLGTAGVGTFGAPFNDANLALPLFIKGKTFCLVGYHELFVPDTTDVLAEIKTMRPRCDRVILFAHWGVEYEHIPTARQRESAHAFIDAGADMVVGAHPHVVQPFEVYNNKAIFYSLGNFLFDQGFQPEVRRGLALSVEFTENNTRFTFIPVNTFKEVSFADASTSQAVLKDLGVPAFAIELAR